MPQSVLAISINVTNDWSGYSLCHPHQAPHLNEYHSNSSYHGHRPGFHDNNHHNHHGYQIHLLRADEKNCCHSPVGTICTSTKTRLDDQMMTLKKGNGFCTQSFVL